MSSPLAIAAVTAALKDLLNDGLLNHDLSSIGSFNVTATPPDRVTTGQNEPNQLNLFLYQVTPNLGWRNEGFPSLDGSGRRIQHPPLALDLHYLLTAYGSQDLNAEVLLGYAMHLLHETPVLTREQLRTSLAAPAPVNGTILPGPFGTMTAIDLADQIELVKIAPTFLTTEDLSKMWTAMQARYRPTMAYTISVVLIQTEGAGRRALPVLRRGPLDRGPDAIASGLPTITAVRPEASELLPALRLGDDLRVTGTHFDLSGTLGAVFENPRLGITQEITPVAPLSSTRLSVHLPSPAEDASGQEDWAIGVYTVSLRITRPDTKSWTSNGVPIAIAPSITVAPLEAGAGDLELTVTCSPRLRPEQEKRVLLVLGSTSIAPHTVDTPGDATQPSTLEFTVPGVEAGDHVVRLRVEGIESLPIVVSDSRLGFDPQQTLKVT